MRLKKTALVYRSKDENDFAAAKTLLTEAGVAFSPFAAEESPVSGCGGKVDHRRYIKTRPVSSVIYRIEVDAADKERAEGVLEGKVQPVRSYGVGL